MIKTNAACQVLDTGVKSAQENMALDSELLERAGELKGPLLHLYDWERPSITYGHFIKPENLLQTTELERRGIDFVKRPTGGGIVFHLFDMAFSVIVPSHDPHYSTNTLENYAFINNAVLRSVQEFLKGKPPLTLTPEDATALDESCHSFCMAKPTKYDVMWGDKKIAGAAQRKTKAGFLHQGTIALTLPDQELLRAVLKPDGAVLPAMLRYTSPILGEGAPPEGTQVAKRELGQLLAAFLH